MITRPTESVTMARCITCSDARQILLESHGRCAQRAVAKDGSSICEAEFDLTKFFAKDDGPQMFIHLTVTAPDGSYALTRAYFRDELG